MTNHLDDIIDEETMDEIELLANMAAIPPEKLIRDAISSHLDFRVGLTEFPKELGRHMESEKDSAWRLMLRQQKVMRKREAARLEQQ